ncbi:small-conductance mechanosensitive channel [Frigoribacterium sp. PvP120]|uniref:mechanosensitive ion channel family protein n=1 Tax=unclassified Frigoribacterium TaxID=2627005 RepID=UPI0017825656|nr:MULTISPECIES: mechanosensitive ion channel domain-containing protein [unclassified Frigoribacterium]MBD8727338.1 mechanosensitive ion channel [Frigoribacterium sp. CFBP 13707]MBP1241347.1 small-conductance mechanosensitive channel [Frigoribacterium sp. PvP121]
MPWIQLVISVAAAVVLTFVVSAVVGWVFGFVAKRKEWAAAFVARMRRPFRWTLLVVLMTIALRTSFDAMFGTPWPGQEAVSQLFRCAVIVVVAWFVGALAIFFEDLGLARYRVDTPDNRVARRVRTQVLILRRLTMVVVVVLALGAVLLGFPGVEAVGASVLASAGLVSVVAGLAAQSTLANVFAGIQLAFSDAIRIDDVVVVEGQWGLIEEITLSYVVVHIWDDRRLVLPSTYFTTTPFENWTRRTSELLGAVELDLDWRVDTGAMRAELDRILAGTDLWDGRTKVLQVTDATGGYVRVRVLVTAKDAGTLFDLRCLVREDLVTWLHAQAPEGVPRSRVQMVDAEPVRPRRPAASSSGSGGLFTGENADSERTALFTQAIPIPIVHDADPAPRPYASSLGAEAEHDPHVAGRPDGRGDGRPDR